MLGLVPVIFGVPKIRSTLPPRLAVPRSARPVRATTRTRTGAALLLRAQQLVAAVALRAHSCASAARQPTG